MSTSKPIHPDLIKHIPMRHTAEIRTHNGWWYRYIVDRKHGFGILENGIIYRRTLNGARRAVRHWEAKEDAYQSVVVE